MEGLLRDRVAGGSSEFRLCQYFDYIGGTSTGAIMAAALALGMSAEELLHFYEEFGRQAFTKRNLFARWKSLYDNGELEKKLKEEFGAETQLFPKDLQTLLLVVTRNATTDSAWPISSNPDALYNDPTKSYCNLQFPLYQVVRASTAAPVFFPPEVVRVDESGTEFVFVDGGTTPYNNPAFLMYRMATEPAYRLNWNSGEDQMLIVSLGTGSAPVLGKNAEDPESNLAAAAVNTMSAEPDSTAHRRPRTTNSASCSTPSFGAPFALWCAPVLRPKIPNSPGSTSSRWVRRCRYASRADCTGAAEHRR